MHVNSAASSASRSCPSLAIVLGTPPAQGDRGTVTRTVTAQEEASIPVANITGPPDVPQKSSSTQPRQPVKFTLPSVVRTAGWRFGGGQAWRRPRLETRSSSVNVSAKGETQ